MGILIQENKDITSLSNYKTPSIARYYFEINQEGDVRGLIGVQQFCKKRKIPFLIIAGGTNMLFAFDEYPGVVVKNNLTGWQYNKETKILEAYSQESIRDISKSLEDNYKQDLWHRFIGLPGSIGGAVFGNAGCFGLEIENNFVSVKVLDLQTGERKELLKSDMEFDYRTSVLKKQEGRYFIISMKFDLSEKKEKYHSDVDNIYFREHKQPSGNSCGSFFKNPSREMPAGKLIEEVGLKGHKVGGAYFSDKHANFLMHDGSGTYKDMLELIQLAKQKVQEKFEIELVNEVRIIEPK